MKIIWQIGKRDTQKIKDFLWNHKNVNSLYKVSPSFDFYVECVFKDMKELEWFKECLIDLDADSEENLIIDELKKEEFALY